MRVNIKRLGTFITIIALTFLCSCKKFIEINPPRNQIISNTVYQNEATATSALMGIYTYIMSSSGNPLNGGIIPIYTGLSSDELVNYSANISQIEFYENNLSLGNSVVESFWKIYQTIYYVNAVIEGVSSSSTLTNSFKNQITGECKFLRSFCHFYLANLFGDIPFITSTDYKENSIIRRIPKQEVYLKIIEDLKESQILLSDNYPTVGNTPSLGRIRPNKSVVNAFLARVYLYIGNYLEAEFYSTLLINDSSNYALIDSLNGVFNKNSKEAIWQLSPVNNYTWEGFYFIRNGIPNSIALSNQIISSFEPNDARKQTWITKYSDSSNNSWYYPYKYKLSSGSSSLGEYTIVLRLAEQYLIRAEARAQQEKLSSGLADLNKVRNRAGLSSVSFTNKADLLLAVEQERKVELFSEWGHRWLDLKRTNRANILLPQIKGTKWQTTDQLFPIPQTQILNDPNMADAQNPGY